MVKHMSVDFQEAIKKFDADEKRKLETAKASQHLEQFRKKFPFKENPSSIDNLKPEDLWEKQKGERDSFFYWLQYRLKGSGHLFIGSKRVFENAIAKIDEFKRLLKIAVDDTKKISEKVDASWENIGFFGGDRHIAKKIIASYNPENVTTIFKTEELEHFCKKVGITEDAIRDEGLAKFAKNYDNLTVGQKWEVLNTLLLNLKHKYKETRSWDNLYFSRFLYHFFGTGIPPRASEATTLSGIPIAPLNKWGLLFAPRCHEEVMYLFSILHREIGFPYIVSIGTEYPDVTAIDDKGETKKLEIEVYATQFNHDPKGCNFIICWENDMKEARKNYPEIIALKDYL